VHAVSMTPHAIFLRSKIDHISANSKQNSKRLKVVNQGPGQGVLFDEKKPEGRKSCDTVLLKEQCHEVLDLRFFLFNNPLVPMIHGLKHF
jgi:hypothetical protein